MGRAKTSKERARNPAKEERATVKPKMMVRREKRRKRLEKADQTRKALLRRSLRAEMHPENGHGMVNGSANQEEVAKTTRAPHPKTRAPHPKTRAPHPKTRKDKAKATRKDKAKAKRKAKEANVAKA